MLPLSDEQLRAIGAAIDALDSRARAAEHWRLGWWAMVASWELSPPSVLWCLSTETHFVACGGGGWRTLGYDPARLADTRWAQYVDTVEDVDRSETITGENIAAGTGFVAFENVYRHADGRGRSRIRWAASPRHEGHAVARGVIL